MRLQKQVCGQIPAEKGHYPIERHRPTQEVQHNSPPPGGLLKSWRFSGHPQKHVPVQPQVQRHEQEPPEGGQHVQRPGKAHAAQDGEKVKHMVGEDHSADHG